MKKCRNCGASLPEGASFCPHCAQSQIERQEVKPPRLWRKKALIAALADGTIDMVATDHAPHTAEEKAREFAKAPSGITGLETAFSVCNTYLVQTGKLTPMQLVDRMSKAPAEIYGLTDRAVQAGNFARLVLLDWDTEKVYETYKSKGINTPYTGKKLTGSPKAIVTGTKVTE